MSHKYLDFDIDAACQAAAKEANHAGWEVDQTARPDGFPAGPLIYLCHYESQAIVLVSLVLGGIEKIQALSEKNNISFQDACNTLGTVLDEVSTRRRKLDSSARKILSSSAAHYIGGTQTYQLAREHDLNQFIVVRHFDASSKERMLRPFVCNHSLPMSPEDVGRAVVEILTIDRKNHPGRFPKGEPLRFRPRSI